MTEPCTSFAPGRALPQGECERCHFQRHEHLEKHRSLPTCSPLTNAATQTAYFADIPACSLIPATVYCRNCGAGLKIMPPADPEQQPCPKCGAAGPKSDTPAT